VESPGEIVKTRERAKDYQLESLAQMAVLGIPPDTMGVTTGLSTEYVTRLVEERRNETFNRYHDKYLAQRTKNATEGHFRLGDILDKAYNGVEEAVEAKDIRVKAENSWKVIHHVTGDPNRKSEGQSGDNITINNPVVQTQVTNTMTAVAEALGGLQAAVAAQDPNAHILIGTDALPIPPSQLEVEQGEASITPTEGPDDLPTELVDEVE
jgi:hypothetical protein